MVTHNLIGQNENESNQVSPSKDTAIAIKAILIKMFNINGIPAVHSRKSCNCGCDIKKEAYIVSKTVSFAAYDFCDSQVFEWNGGEGDALELIKKVQVQLTQLGYLHLNGFIKEKQKFRIRKFSIETPDLLTFIEVSSMKDGSLKLKLSIATP